MPSARRWEVEGRFGSKLTCRHLIAMSALPPKADMCSATRYVRFVPTADISPFILLSRRRARAATLEW